MYEQISSNKRRTVVLLVFFLALLWGLAWVISQSTGQPGLFFIIGIFALSYAVFSYFAGSKMAIAVNGAQQIQKKDNPRLWRTVENLAITEGLPMPKVYIMNDLAPNAFATGRDPAHGVVCATTGLLQIMDDNELEGVIAHELGHVKNYDVRVTTLAFALVGVISLIADFFLHISFWGGRGDRENNNQIMIFLAIFAAIIAPIAASLLQLAISRRREYLADATGALTTRYPEGLASALEKIASHGSALKKQNTSTAHMFFVNPLKGKSLAGLFSTHPPVEARIKALREMKL
ncbi:protease [Candidatus Saccharibacteria bacterium CG10_big_fil_rev_8_21_14_0_10_47_8]|nr:MAG: protease [Candidatus Saccharibacteria bacterium CG10_big_fil_rev_8_21_14_0_10_47_8]